MNQKNDKHSEQTALEEFVTAAIAEDMDLASEYRDMLSKHDIPVALTAQRGYSSAVVGIAVMVPEHCLEEAQELIESQQAFDDFLDMAFNNADEDQEPFFDEDLFDSPQDDDDEIY